MEIEWVDGVDGPIRPPKEPAPRDETVVRNAPIPMLAPIASPTLETLLQPPKRSPAKTKGEKLTCPFCKTSRVSLWYHLPRYHSAEIDEFFADHPRNRNYIQALLRAVATGWRPAAQRPQPEPMPAPDHDWTDTSGKEAAARDEVVVYKVDLLLDANDIAGIVLTGRFGSAMVPLAHVAAFSEWQRATIAFLSAIS